MTASLTIERLADSLADSVTASIASRPDQTSFRAVTSMQTGCRAVRGLETLIAIPMGVRPGRLLQCVSLKEHGSIEAPGRQTRIAGFKARLRPLL